MSDPPPVLTGPRLTLRERVDDDRDALVAVFEQPGVRRWWGSGFSSGQNDDEDTVGQNDDEDTVGQNDDEDTVGQNDDEDTVEFVVIHHDRIIGLIQYHEETDPKYRHAGIDLAIGDDHQGKGFGPEAIRLVVDHLASLGHHRVVIDPNAANQRAIRAYAKVGFKPVGVMRRYEWDEDEHRWSDGLLMDLLIGEPS